MIPVFVVAGSMTCDVAGSTMISDVRASSFHSTIADANFLNAPVVSEAQPIALR